MFSNRVFVCYYSCLYRYDPFRSRGMRTMQVVVVVAAQQVVVQFWKRQNRAAE